MLKKIFVLIVLPAFLSCNGLHPQEDVARFCRYDQPVWSPDGQELAFRCLYLQEGEPADLHSNILVKNMASGSLICLNPKPERFVISKDKKYVLFSDLYGIYLMNLRTKTAPVQIQFKDPTSVYLVEKLGFYESSHQVYFQLKSMWGEDSVFAAFSVDTSSYRAERIVSAKYSSLKKTPTKKMTTLLVDGPVDWQTRPFRTSEGKFEFLFLQRTAPDEYDLEDLVRINRKTKESTKIFERCRRRLFSFSPDENRIIFSIYTPQKGEQTWLMHSDGTNLKLVDDTGYYFVSWLDNTRYLCTSPKGFFQRSIDGSENVKLDDWPIPQWCQTIDLGLPGFEIQITCEENKQKADSLLAFLKNQGFRGRTEFYQDKGTKCYRVRIGPYTSLKQAKASGEKLASLGFQFWIDKIENAYDYLLKARAEDEAVFGDKKAVIKYQINHFPRSRILLTDVKSTLPFHAGRKEQILMDEMNNFQPRSKW